LRKVKCNAMVDDSLDDGLLARCRRVLSPHRMLQRGEVSGALGDLGTFLPDVVALSSVMGSALPAASFVFFSGLWNLVSGCLPIQPMHTVVAVVLTEGLTYPQLVASGLWLGAMFTLLGGSGSVERARRCIPVCVVRGLQLGLGAHSLDACRPGAGAAAAAERALPTTRARAQGLLDRRRHGDSRASPPHPQPRRAPRRPPLCGGRNRAVRRPKASRQPRAVCPRLRRRGARAARAAVPAQPARARADCRRGRLVARSRSRRAAAASRHAAQRSGCDRQAGGGPLSAARHAERRRDRPLRRPLQPLHSGRRPLSVVPRLRRSRRAAPVWSAHRVLHGAARPVQDGPRRRPRPGPTPPRLRRLPACGARRPARRRRGGARGVRSSSLS